MEFKSHAHTEIIAHLDALNDQLGVARNAFLLKDAEKDHFEATLVISSQGKSVAERRIAAQSLVAWKEFHVELARLEAVYEFLKLKFRVLENEYQSQYLEAKLNEGLIKKQI